jgi:hypothetical protein
MELTLQLLLTGTLGAAAAYSRLTQEFRDAPVLAALTPSGVVYIAVSTLISWSALGLLVAAGWNFGLGAETSPLWVDLVRAVVAGGGPPLVLHSSLVSVKVGDLTLDPSAFGTAILEQTRRGVHRSRAARRLRRKKCLTGLVFEQHCVALAELVSGALQDPDPQYALELGRQMGALTEREDLSDDLKLVLFQLALMNLAGERAVHRAAERLRAMDAGRSCCQARRSGRDPVGRCPREHIDLTEGSADPTPFEGEHRGPAGPEHRSTGTGPGTGTGTGPGTGPGSGPDPAG